MLDLADCHSHQAPEDLEDKFMHTVERTFRLEGRSGLGAKPRPELIGPVLSELHDTLQDAVRMGFLHSSKARGRVPAGLRAAADVRYLGHRADSDDATILRFEVAPFGEVAEELFTQKQIWDDGPRADQTAFELLGEALNDVGTRRMESSRFDPGLLRRIGRYRALFRKDGLSRIALPDTTLAQPGQIDAEVVASARELSSVTPAPRRVRIAGRLDLMGASQGVLKLDLGREGIVTALWEGTEPIEELKALFNRDVVCEGQGVFRPSGSLLRIDADAIAPASDADAFFRQLPLAVARFDLSKSIRLRGGEAPVFASFLQSIPPEESDEEFASAVEELS